MKQETAKKVLSTTTSQKALSLQSDKEERIVNNVAIKLIQGAIEKEGANVSRTLTMF